MEIPKVGALLDSGIEHSGLSPLAVLQTELVDAAHTLDLVVTGDAPIRCADERSPVREDDGSAEAVTVHAVGRPEAPPLGPGTICALLKRMDDAGRNFG